MRGGNLLNTNVGEYRLIDYLGAGGMGEVYRAVHTKIGRVVAVKVLCGAAAAGSGERFHNEARIQSRLHHHGIAALYDYAEVQGRPCIVMEYVHGETIEEHIRLNGALPHARALKIFEDVVEAVSYVHRSAVVHRDIKSNNIKLGPAGEVKLLDFGIAKSDTSPNLTAAGGIVGTLYYLSPEQVRGRPADALSDIWALGVLLYEMVTGVLPFQAETAGSLLLQISNATYVRPTELNPTLPRETEAIITRCLKKNPAQRFGSAEELLAEVRRLRAAEHFEPPAEHARAPLAPRQRSALKFLAFGGLAALVAMYGVVMLFSAAVYIFGLPEPTAPAVERPSESRASSAKEEARGEDVRTVRVSALEGEAEVYRDGRMVGVTPFELRERIGAHVALVLKRDGYADKRVEFSVTENKREYTIALDPAAAK